MKKKRKYTGTTDGASAGKRAGLEEFARQVNQLSKGVLWHNGSWVVRPKSGKKTLSVHATGRAVDLSWRKVGRKGRVNGRERAEATIQLLIDNANYLGIECILDYFPGPHGRGWRCDRQAWQNYGKRTIASAPGSDWYHIEIAPRFADKPAEYIKRFATLKGTPQV
jgi:hypothetical protein